MEDDSLKMVSIIVPVYNVEKYLRCCLDSIRNQTYRDFEVIMVDDGSTDHSYAICKEYESIDERFRVIHQENQGSASSRNNGIKEAKGEFLYFVDSDDCINIYTLELLVHIAEEKQANIVQTGFRDVPSDFDGYCEKVIDLEQENADEYVKKYTLQECIYNLERGKTDAEYRLNLCTVVVWTKLYRVSAFQSLLFPEGMRINEDQMVAHRNIIQAGGMVCVDLPLYYYRKAEGSLIRVGWTPKRLSIIACYEDRLKWLEDLPEKTERKEELLDYVSYRFLICIFRNYYMASQVLTGQEKAEVCNQLRMLMKEKYKILKTRIPLFKKIFFLSFIGMPRLVVFIFDKRRKLLHL